MKDNKKEVLSSGLTEQNTAPAVLSEESLAEVGGGYAENDFLNSRPNTIRNDIPLFQIASETDNPLMYARPKAKETVQRSETARQGLNNANLLWPPKADKSDTI